jgi:hypothetical protein
MAEQAMTEWAEQRNLTVSCIIFQLAPVNPISSDQFLAQLLNCLLDMWASFLRNQLEDISGTVRISGQSMV